MCIAILNVPNHQLQKSVIQNSYESNPDGTGFIWVENGKLMTYKMLTQGTKRIWQVYRKIRTRVPESYIVLHFRIATSGLVDLDNCHPFMVNDGLAFVHNGIINGLGGLKQSDTNQFNSDYLSKLPPDFLENEGIIGLISGVIGCSKLLFLSQENEPTIINEDLGHRDDYGNWYSNHTYKDFSYDYKPSTMYNYANKYNYAAKPDYSRYGEINTYDNEIDSLALRSHGYAGTGSRSDNGFYQECGYCAEKHYLTYNKTVNLLLCANCQYIVQ